MESATNGITDPVSDQSLAALDAAVRPAGEPTPRPHPAIVAESALAYARRGWAVFPVHGIGPDGRCRCGGLASCEGGRNAGKHPATPRGCLDATTNAAQVQLWWSPAMTQAQNIGLATGAVSGVVVLDADPPSR